MENHLLGYQNTGVIAFWALQKLSGGGKTFLPDQNSQKYIRFDFFEQATDWWKTIEDGRHKSKRHNARRCIQKDFCATHDESTCTD